MIIIDSNMWIFAENVDAEERQVATRKIREIFASEVFGINMIIVSEVYHILSRRVLEPEEAARRIKNILEHPSMQWLDLPQETVINAINLSKNVSISINDAIIAEQALRFNAKLLTDNIKDFRKVKGLELIPLR